jgi:hypothetical protein
MSLSANDWMMIWGAGLIVLAILIMWRASRYDLKGAAFDSAWQLARGKRTAENPTEIEKRLGEIASEASVTGKAKRAAGTVIGHFAAQVLGVVAWLMLLAGAALAAAGYFWT